MVPPAVRAVRADSASVSMRSPAQSRQPTVGNPCRHDATEESATLVARSDEDAPRPEQDAAEPFARPAPRAGAPTGGRAPPHEALPPHQLRKSVDHDELGGPTDGHRPDHHEGVVAGHDIVRVREFVVVVRQRREEPPGPGEVE